MSYDYPYGRTNGIISHVRRFYSLSVWPCGGCYSMCSDYVSCALDYWYWYNITEQTRIALHWNPSVVRCIQHALKRTAAPGVSRCGLESLRITPLHTVVHQVVQHRVSTDGVQISNQLYQC